MADNKAEEKSASAGQEQEAPPQWDDEKRLEPETQGAAADAPPGEDTCPTDRLGNEPDDPVLGGLDGDSRERPRRYPTRVRRPPMRYVPA
ncbi:hypothetical protein MTO96_028647 [Rhipicephalus appendiculatus]